jgi:hypothetical protein
MWKAIIPPGIDVQKPTDDWMIYWPEGHLKKRFFFITYKWAEYAGAFVPGKPVQPSVMFAGKARGLVKSGVLNGAPFG